MKARRENTTLVHVRGIKISKKETQRRLSVVFFFVFAVLMAVENWSHSILIPVNNFKRNFISVAKLFLGLFDFLLREMVCKLSRELGNDINLISKI